jgi:hypothetical protein
MLFGAIFRFALSAISLARQTVKNDISTHPAFAVNKSSALKAYYRWHDS